MSSHDNDDIMNAGEQTEILSPTDDKIKTLGQLLSSDSGRKIIDLLFENELTATQIAEKTGMSIQMVKHYLNKMQYLGITEICRTSQNEKGVTMKYYTITKIAVIIMPSKLTEKAKRSLFGALRRVYRVAAIGSIAIASWFSTGLFFNYNEWFGQGVHDHLREASNALKYVATAPGSPHLMHGNLNPVSAMWIRFGVIDIPVDIAWSLAVSAVVTVLSFFAIFKHKRLVKKEPETVVQKTDVTSSEE